MDLAEVNGRLLCTVGGTGLIARSTGDVSRWTASTSPLRAPARCDRRQRVSDLGSRSRPVDGFARRGAGRQVKDQPAVGRGRGVHTPLSSPISARWAKAFAADRAADDDGVLDVCIVPRRGRLSLVTKLAALRTGRPLGPDVLRVERATTARIELERPCPFAADGEVIFEDRTFVVHVRPSALQVLV